MLPLMATADTDHSADGSHARSGAATKQITATVNA